MAKQTALWNAYLAGLYDGLNWKANTELRSRPPQWQPAFSTPMQTSEAAHQLKRRGPRGDLRIQRKGRRTSLENRVSVFKV